MMEATPKTLILCVDQDNDVGKWTGVATPIIGKENTIQAATNLAIADPEEADANAMFGAVRILNRITIDHPDEEFQIATITGTSNGGIEADRKMMKELSDVLRQFPADGLILVTDGFVDDSLKPIIQSRIPITSVQHIVVKHSERIEETYLIFFKYLKMLIDDPYYSRIALGVPGVLLIIFGFLLASNQLQNAGLAVTFVIGIVLFVKGFGIYNRALEFKPILPPPETQIIFVSRLIGAVVVLVGAYQGVVGAASALPNNTQPLWDLTYWAGEIPALVANFILTGVDLIVFGVLVAFIGSAVFYFLQKDEKLGNNIIGAIVAFWMRNILPEAAQVFLNPKIRITITSPLVIYTLASISSTILAVALIYRHYKKLPFT